MSLGVKGDLKQEIFNEVNENVRALERLFPSVVKDGQVDFEALKEELGQFEEVGPEKYGLTWSGKQNAKKIAQEDIVGKTLKYIPEDSKNPETTENLYIEGDNLEVLKLLRQNYYGAIKMIYIDPPYNTGNDFVYNDNYKMNKYKSDQEEGNISDLGERYTVNSKSSNKYHANWLNMMYPRLKVAKDLLRHDGIIFISIDDNELDNMKKICNEVFGEINLIAILPTIMNMKGNNDQFGFAGTHEYTLVYIKDKSSIEDLNGVDLTDEDKKEYNLVDEKGFYKQGATLMRTGEAGAREKRPRGYYPIYVSKDLKRLSIDRKDITDYEIYPKTKEGKDMSWRRSKENLANNSGEFIIKNNNGNISFYKKQRLEEDIIKGKKAKTLFYKPEYSSGNGTSVVKELLHGRIFNNPKPIALIIDFIKIGMGKNDIVLDFFSGSATTAHAVMKLNNQDCGNRKYIMIQLPEATSKKSEAYKAGYKNICQIGRKRIDKAGDKITEENKDKEGIEDLDIGFKVFRVGDTNIRWNYEKEDLKTLSNEVTIRSSEEQTTFDFIAATNNQVNLDETVSAKDRLDFMPGFKDIDIVYEILLRQRDIPLSAKVELLEDIGKRTYIFADSYLVCLEEDITVELIEKLAELNPLPIKFILRDSAFGDDIALKDEAYRRLKALIERNSGESKKTYTVEFI